MSVLSPLSLGIDLGLLVMPFLLLACSSFGRRLRVEGLFAQSLWGLALLALPVTALCAFRADWAVSTLKGGLFFAAFLSGMDLRDYREPWPWRGIAVIVGLFFIFAALNLPAFAFIHREGGRAWMDFNGHFSYYASLSNELLRADYPSRLRVMSAWPLEWSRYHFFPSVTQAALQVFSPSPNLGTYFQAQAVLAFFILASFAEALLARGAGMLKSGLWLVGALTFFGAALSWQMTTSAAYGIFALVFGVWALAAGRRDFAVLCAALLAAASPRNLPASAALVVTAALVGDVHLWPFLRDFLRNGWRVVFVAFMMVAGLVALTSGHALLLEPADPLAPAWLEALIGLQLWDHWRSLGGVLFGEKDLAVGLEWIRPGAIGLVAGLVSLGILLTVLGGQVRDAWRNPSFLPRWKGLTRALVMVALLFAFAVVWGGSERILSPAAVACLAMYSWLLFGALLRTESALLKAGVIGVLIVSFLATWIFPKALAYPAMMTAWDGTLLAASGVALLRLSLSRRQIVFATVFLTLWCQPRWTRFFWIAHDRVHARTVDVTGILDEGLRESATSDGFLKPEAAGADLDLTAALLGARLRPEQTQTGIEFMARGFTDVERKDDGQ